MKLCLIFALLPFALFAESTAEIQSSWQTNQVCHFQLQSQEENIISNKNRTVRHKVISEVSYRVFVEQVGLEGKKLHVEFDALKISLQLNGQKPSILELDGEGAENGIISKQVRRLEGITFHLDAKDRITRMTGLGPLAPGFHRNELVQKTLAQLPKLAPIELLPWLPAHGLKPGEKWRSFPDSTQPGTGEYLGSHEILRRQLNTGKCFSFLQ